MTLELTSVRESIRHWLATDPPVAQFELRVADVDIRVASNSPELIAILRHYYRAFVIPPPAEVTLRVYALQAPPVPVDDLQFTPLTPRGGRRRIKDEFLDLPDGRILHKLVTDMLFLFDGGDGLAIGPCLRNTNQVVNFINNRFMQGKLEGGYVLAHAAAVARDGRGWALAGMPGRGKSTLALHVLNRGCDFATNDGLLLRRAGARLEMLGLPKFPRVNPGTILHNPRLGALLSHAERARFAALPSRELWELEQKYDVDVLDVYGPTRMQLAGTVAGTLILNWRRQAAPPEFRQVELADRPDLLEALSKPLTVNFFPAPGRPVPDFSPHAYLDRLGDCPVYEATGGVDFDAAADWCAKQL